MNKQGYEYLAREVNQIEIDQRINDGYINATALCKAAGKRLNNYIRTAETKAFIDELSRDTLKSASELIQVVKGGNPELQGTWVHPYVAINFGQWLSPKFAVQVSKWVHDWIAHGYTIEVEYHKHESYKQAMKEQGSEAGRFLSNLRWHINPAIEGKDRYFEESRQLSLFPDTKKAIH